MRVSKIYGIKRSQGELDFVDVDIDKDIPLFLDPRAIAQINNSWARSCVSSLQSFFQRVIEAIHSGDDSVAISLLTGLGEPNETHLGLSKGKSRGSAVGEKLAVEFWQALSKSRAVQSGLIQDLEDTALLIENVDKDRISDITTNIIRRQLVEFTYDTCKFWNIPLTENVAYGNFWNSRQGVWYQDHVDIPTPKGEPLLLVPKSIVRRKLHMNANNYYRHSILNFLVSQESAANALTSVVRGQHQRVTKKDVDARWKGEFDAGRHNPGVEKRINAHVSAENPDILDSYREERHRTRTAPLDNADLSDVVGSRRPNVRRLLQEVTATPKGRSDAHSYEENVFALFEALFYPHLIYPNKQTRMHEGRKRVDLSFTNDGSSGFFRWVARNYPAGQIFVECKNYDTPLGNPEVDQLLGRFSPSRGQVGILVYRGAGDKQKVDKLCVDAARQKNEFVLAIDDDDLRAIVDEHLDLEVDYPFKFLQQRFQHLANN
ncbi:hypothetical protein ACTI_78430 [Actinoplanes sp. OR16]|uniref:restriction endonuclease n=1 Tax=Actinoplanes sp. OR16 TaxID=946334 RepID=UPI000F6E2FBA|nr:restriction endonuclease [Actinoplanes sp. OR16]BBH71158.1 hypothetical protein ACTI_78430 [Actinoplanes sp. OR16]